MADDGPITCEELLDTLTGWIGREVRILLGPEGSTAGRVYVRWNGRLRAARPDSSLWTHGEDGAEPIAFQIGDDPDSFFAVHANALRHAEWVSRRHEFLMFGMTGVELGIKCQPGD